MAFLLGASDQQVGTDGNPDLGLYGIGRLSIEGLDLEMVLDPLEEQFDLPALAVDLGDCGCRQGQMIGQKDEAFVPRLIDETDAAQPLRVSRSGLCTGQPNQLVAAHPGGLVRRSIGFAPAVAEVFLGDLYT